MGEERKAVNYIHKFKSGLLEADCFYEIKKFSGYKDIILFFLRTTNLLLGAFLTEKIYLKIKISSVPSSVVLFSNTPGIMSDFAKSERSSVKLDWVWGPREGVDDISSLFSRFPRVCLFILCQSVRQRLSCLCACVLCKYEAIHTLTCSFYLFGSREFIVLVIE